MRQWGKEDGRRCRELQDKQAMHVLQKEASKRLQVEGAPGHKHGPKNTMVGVESWARDEQGWLRELRFGLRATLGLGKKRACTFGTHDNHRQTSLVSG